MELFKLTSETSFSIISINFLWLCYLRGFFTTLTNLILSRTELNTKSQPKIANSPSLVPISLNFSLSP